ncbi:MAG TPA: response regulator transcription factor [Bacteroidia bacterium]|jgi:DNA-binding response OmpR family regulator|nr:response regulator transcription factor [Bacteroidia bacterium]
MKILLIEDEKSLSDSILSYLREEGHTCELASDFSSAEMKTGIYGYDCVVVDITLPGGSGLDIIADLKKKGSEAGIIIISAKNSLDDKVQGLDLGADDYLTKPFHLSELNSRIKSIIRRRNFKGSNEIVFNEIAIIPEEMQVTIKKKPVTLTRKEFDLLLFFVSNKNRVLTKESIAEHLWGDDMDTSDSFDFIYSHIKNLRKKLIEKGAEDYIQTVYGLGYKFG